MKRERPGLLHQTHHHLLRIVLILFGIKHHWQLFAPIRELKDISVAHGEQIQEVERTRQELIITDRGKPVLKIMPYSDDPHEVLKKLRGSLLKYEDPTEPVES